MKTWDPDSISRGFLWQAEDAERYLREVRKKVQRNASYEHVHDEHLARFYVFNHLHDRPFLSSPDDLLMELRRLTSTTFSPPREAFDPQRFEHYRQIYLAHLIEQYAPRSSDARS